MNIVNQLLGARRQSGCSPLVLIGLAGVAFLAGLLLLWTNEGRVDFGRIATASKPVRASEIGPELAGAFVAVEGVLAADEPIGDPPYLRAGDWLELNRHVEMYAWKETRNSRAGDSPGAYSYTQEWSSAPEDSSAFAQPEGHHNPDIAVPAAQFRPTSAYIGDWAVDIRSLDLPPATPVTLSPEMALLGPGQSLHGDFVFIGQGSFTDPQVGDLRIHYTAVPSGIPVTLFGQVGDGRVEPYMHRGKERLYRAFQSSRTDAIDQMGAEYRFALWGSRIGGMILLWIAFMLALSPFMRLLGAIPVLGGLGKGLLAILTLLLAAVITVIVATISYLFHNPLTLVVLIVLTAMAFAVLRAVLMKGDEPRDGLAGQ